MSGPHVHTVIVSYKRSRLTALTVAAYRATVSIPYSLLIVDNGSPLEDLDRIMGLGAEVLQLDRNYFPGYATNRGWEHAPENTTLYHRLDNDMRPVTGWCEDMLAAFGNPKVGQYGLTVPGDGRWLHDPDCPVGGNTVIRREVYDAGIRYSEVPWRRGEDAWEDGKLYHAVKDAGWQRAFSSFPTLAPIADPGNYEYYVETYRARGLRPPARQDTVHAAKATGDSSNHHTETTTT